MFSLAQKTIVTAHDGVPEQSNKYFGKNVTMRCTIAMRGLCLTCW
jgi:hypothetical protein